MDAQHVYIKPDAIGLSTDASFMQQSSLIGCIPIKYLPLFLTDSVSAMRVSH